MSAKHFVNDPNHAVLTALRSLTLTNPSLCFDENNKIVYRNPVSIASSKDKISIICGGGSGHEPGWPGYVGRGLLTACVAGTIFASPGAQQVRTCLAHRIPKDSKGVLVLVMNYTGDVLNFGMGVEKARAVGKDAEILVVGDDVGVGRDKGGKVGRRGIAGGAIVLKICGAMAEMGASLEETIRAGKIAAENIVSVAVSLSRVHVPGRSDKDAVEELERLPQGTMEIGMGIHNEPGCEKLETDLPGAVKKMLAQLLDQNDKDRAYVKIDKSDKTVMLMNNFGGLSNLEMGAITTETWTQLTKNYGIRPVRIISGVYNGSLNGLGFGITLLKLMDTRLGEGRSLLELFDYPAEAIGWPTPINPETWNNHYPKNEQKVDSTEEGSQPGNLRVDPETFERVLEAGLKRVIAAESDVTAYDRIAGDGDCGIGLKRGAEAVQQMLKTKKPSEDLLTTFSNVVHVVENTMDGTSGALYAIYLNSLEHNLRVLDSSSPTEITPQIWAKALSLSLEALTKYTPAQVGDRTLVDALAPFVETLQKTGDVEEAAKAAQKGAAATKGMRASLGRTVYVGGESWREVPDPGAHGLAEFFLGIADGL